MPSRSRHRLDVELVRRGLSESREQALQAITEGRVLVAGAPADKPARLVSPAEPIALTGVAPRFVSRGGEKLDAALENFGIDVAGARALDAGASTGGFTDCLLQRGAALVYAVDVGRGQLHPRIRGDERVVVLERTNVRHLGPEDLDPPGAADVVVGDLSFVSLRSVAQPLTELVVESGALVLLVKPQFEVGRVAASRAKGVIVDPLLWRQALDDVSSTLVDDGTGIMGAMVSPLRGAAGNTEFLLYARRGVAGVPDLTALLDRVVSTAGEGR